MARDKQTYTSDGNSGKTKPATRTTTTSPKTVNTQPYGSNYGGVATQNTPKTNVYGSNYGGVVSNKNNAPKTSTSVKTSNIGKTTSNTRTATPKTTTPTNGVYGSNYGGITSNNQKTTSYGVNYGGITSYKPLFNNKKETLNRSSFDSDDAYERYLVENDVNVTSGDALSYIKEKANSNNQLARDYAQDMQKRVGNVITTEKVKEASQKGELTQTQSDVVNSFYKIVDKDNNVVDESIYQNDVQLYNDTASTINNDIVKLDEKYKKGQIDYQTYQTEYNKIASRYNENEVLGERLRGYEFKQGFDYYDWAKANGQDTSDFEKMVGSLDDNVLERLGNLYASSVVDTLNIIPQAVDIVHMMADRYQEDGFKITDENALSNQLSKQSNELRQYAMAGTEGFENWSLQTVGSLMPMINSMLLTGGSDWLVNVMMGAQTAGQVTRQRLSEGNDVTSATLNGAIHGTIAGLVEGLDAGKVASLFTGEAGKFLLSNALFSKTSMINIAKYMNAIGMAEGAEEIIEYFADIIADNAQNLITNSVTGKINVEYSTPQELANQFVMAYAGAFLMGAPTAINVTIDSKQRYNGAMEARKYFESIVNSDPDLNVTQQEKDLAQWCINAIDFDAGVYKNRSQTADAVELQTDKVESLGTYEEVMNSLVNAMRDDAQIEIGRAQETLNRTQQLEVEIQDALLKKGYNVSAREYLNANEQQRSSYKQVLDFLNENGINNALVKMKRGRNGVNLSDGILLNTDQTETIDPDALADLDNREYTNIVQNNIDAIFDKAGINSTVESTASHEISHFAEKSGKWNELRDIVKNMMGEERFEVAKNRIEEIYNKRLEGEDVTVNPESEVVAFFIQKNLGNVEFLNRLANTNSSIFGRLFSNAKALFSDDAMARLENAFGNAIYQARQKAMHAGTPNYSIGSLFQSIDMVIEKDSDDSIIAINKDGDKVREISTADVENSPLGQMIRESEKNGFTKNGDQQIEMMTQLCNTILSTQDADLFWAISGSIGYNKARVGQNTSDTSKSKKFSALTDNADNQYSYTFDVTTICTKTQQLIDVASKVMSELGRGLTQREIIDIVYKEVYEANEPVPCPVCYVFSRWVGLGGILNNIKDFQEKYKGADLNELKERYETLSKQVDKIAKRRGISGYKAQDELRKATDEKVQQEYNALYSEDMVEQLGGKKMTKEQREELKSLEADLQVLNDWSWITNVLLDVKTKNGVKTIKLNQKYLENGDVPDKILFDLNKGEDFSKYSAWKYRTTRGTPAGKTIAPYTDMVLGQTILGVASTSRIKNLGNYRDTNNNAFLDAEQTQEQQKQYAKAIKNSRVQNLKGGLRAQTTSDFRFEYVTDYILHFMQMQAIGSYGQTYTKVPEAVPMLASVGYETNMSLMPKGKGYVKARKGEKYAFYVEGFDGVKDGYYKLDFSDVTGINHDEAFYLREKYDCAQTIMVGVNDVHNYLSRLDPRVDFIIAYHASGGTQENYASMMDTVNENISEGDRQSYETSQNDERVKNPTVDQQEAYDLRMKILTGEAKKLTKREQRILDNNQMLGELWKRFYVKGYDAECYNVKFTKNNAKTIFPYEYWDKTSTRETANINGERFASYCESIGIVPRFSQWAGQEGYWKYLIDRSMYNVDGTYHYQQVVNLDNFNSDFLFRDKMVEGMVQPKNATKQFDRSKTSKIASEVIKKVNKAQYAIGKQYDTAVENGDTKTAGDLVKQYAQNYADETGQQLFEGYHGTNAVFNEFLREKLGSKNFLADSAYKAFFMAGSEDTAKNYTGLNSMDMAKLNFDEDILPERKRIADKYNLTDLNKQVKMERDKYINDALENALAQELPLDSKGLPDIHAIMIRMLRNGEYGELSEEDAKRLEQTHKDYWEAGNNHLHREFENNSELYKRYKELEKKAIDDFEEFGIKYLGYEPNIKHLFAFMKNPLVHDFKNEGRDEAFTDLIDEAKANGNDGVVFLNVKDGGDFDTIYAVFEPNQFKSADAITYDDNGNVIPLSERINQETNDLRYSLGKEDNAGYHYGEKDLDLNFKSERLGSRDNRNSGAFGTGTYFFGELGKSDPSEKSYTENPKKTEHKVDFTDYNLFKPRNRDDGTMLHDIFKTLDHNYTYVDSITKAEAKQRVSDIINEINELDKKYDTYDFTLTPEQEEDFRNRLLELGDDEEFVDRMFDEYRNRDDRVMANYLASDLYQRYIDESVRDKSKKPESLANAKKYEKIENSVPELAKILGEDEDYMYDVVHEAVRSANTDRGRRDFWYGNYDSVGTRVMKKLGYEGIDVRDIKGLDNSFYGSVIYDLKPNTIQYNLSREGGGNGGGPTKPEVDVVDGYAPRKNQRFATSNIPKSNIFSDEQKEKVEQDVKAGKFQYQSLVNNVETQRAREYLERDGVDKTFDSFMAVNNPNVKSVIQGEVLLEKLLKDNDSRWEKVASKLADDATIAGQFLQAYAIMQKLSPEGRLMVVQRNLKRAQRKLDNKMGNKAPQLELNQALVDELMKATDPDESRQIQDKIYKDLVDQTPKGFREIINTWRYLAMLGNPRTHVRNFLGNGVFLPFVDIKNSIGAVLESAFADKLEYKTKAHINRLNAGDKALLDAGRRAYGQYKSAIEKDQKYEHSGFSNKNLLGRIGNAVSDFNSKLLDKEDFVFSKHRYAKSYAEFLKANGFTEETLTPDMRVRANEYARTEAEKATYRDANAVADWLNELSTSDKKGLRIASYVKDAIMPFTKTPMNIVKRGVEYSPIGLLKTIVYDSKQLADGKITANQYIDNMASGLTGTGIALIGALLRSMGLFKTKDDDKDRKQYFDKENGEQEYAIDLSPFGVDGTYTIDWASPVIMPFAIGSELFDAFSEMEGVDGFDGVIDAVANVSAKVMDPVMETSMLSSLQDALKSYSTSGGAWLGDMITSMVSSYVLQMFPTFGGQIARTIDETRRTTSPNGGKIYKLLKQIYNKIPWRSKVNQPYINRQGQEEKTEDLGMGWLGRAFLNMISPGYYSSKDIDEYDMEMYRLYEQTGSYDAFPSSASRDLEFEGEKYKFTPEQYTQWHQTRWQTETEYVNQFMDSRAYEKLSDEERVETIKDIRGYAQKVAKKQFLESQGFIYTDDKELAESDDKYVYDKQLSGAQGAVDKDIDLYAYFDYLNNSGSKQAEKIQYLEESDLTQSQKEYLWSLNDYKKSYEDVYKKVFGDGSSSSSGKKKSSKGSKKSSSKKKVSTAGVGSTSIKKGGSVKMASPQRIVANPSNRQNSNLVNSYLSAYSTSLNRGKPSTGGASATVVCPRCGNKVSSASGRCPICGTKL